MLRSLPAIVAALPLAMRAQGALLVAQFQLYTRPKGSLLPKDAAHGGREGSLPPLPPLATRRTVWQVASAVRRASTYGVFRPKCLVRSLALHRLLQEHGIEGSVIRVGVRKVEGKFEAHAWVELASRVVGDERDHVAGFAELMEFRMAAAPSDAAISG